MAARLDAADAGARRAAVRGHGVPPRARHRVVTAAGLAARGPDHAGAAPSLDGRDAARGRRRRRGRPHVRAGTPYAARLLAAARRAHAAAHRHPRLLAPDDEGRFGGGPYGDDRLGDDFYWAAAELWLATGERPFLAELMAFGRHTADVFDLAGFDFDRVAAPARIDLALARRRAARTATGCAASVVAAGERCWRCRTGSRGASRTRRATAGTGARTAGSSTTSSCSSPRTCSPASAGSATASPRHGLSARPQRARAELRHRLRHRRHPAPAHPPVRQTDVRRRRRVGGRGELQDTPGFPTDPRLVGRPPQCCYLDEPTSETTNDMCIRWNAPLAAVARYLGSP